MCINEMSGWGVTTAAHARMECGPRDASLSGRALWPDGTDTHVWSRSAKSMYCDIIGREVTEQTGRSELVHINKMSGWLCTIAAHARM